jgi:hypothetical protein
VQNQANALFQEPNDKWNIQYSSVVERDRVISMWKCVLLSILTIDENGCVRIIKFIPTTHQSSGTDGVAYSFWQVDVAPTKHSNKIHQSSVISNLIYWTLLKKILVYSYSGRKNWSVLSKVIALAVSVITYITIQENKISTHFTELLFSSSPLSLCRSSSSNWPFLTSKMKAQLSFWIVFHCVI